MTAITRRHRRWLTAMCALAGFAVVASCQPASPAGEDTKATPAATTTSTSAVAVAQRRLDDAVAATLGADTGRFRLQVLVGGRPVGLSATGVYSIARHSLQLTQTAGKDQMTIKYVDDVLYASMSGWPAAMRRCWLQFNSADFAEVGVTGVGAGRLPAAHLAALEDVRLTKVDPELQTGTVDVALGVPLFGLGVLQVAGDPRRLKGRLDAAVEVNDGKVTGLAVSGKGLPKILAAAGVTLSADQRDTFAATSVVVEYSRHGAPVTIAAPPPNLRMTDAQVRAGGCG